MLTLTSFLVPTTSHSASLTSETRCSVSGDWASRYLMSAAHGPYRWRSSDIVPWIV